MWRHSFTHNTKLQNSLTFLSFPFKAVKLLICKNNLLKDKIHIAKKPPQPEKNQKLNLKIVGSLRKNWLIDLYMESEQK